MGLFHMAAFLISGMIIQCVGSEQEAPLTWSEGERALRAHVLQFMDPAVPPREDPSDPTEVHVSLNVFKVKSIDIATSSMHLLVWLRMTWVDRRLAWNVTDPRWKGVDQTAFVGSLDRTASEVWVPDLELINQEESLATLPSKDIQAGPSGSLFWSRVGTLKALCAFRGLEYHPFDQLACSIELGGWGRSGLFANYSLSSPAVDFGGSTESESTFQEQVNKEHVGEEEHRPPYQFPRDIIQTYVLDEQRTSAVREEVFYPCCPNEPWPTLTYTFFADRASAFYLKALVLPNVVLSFLSFGTFWFDVRCGERLSFGITVLLAMVAADIIAASKLPICREWLWIEKMTGGCVLFAVLALAESCVVIAFFYRVGSDNVNSDVVPRDGTPILRKSTDISVDNDTNVAPSSALDDSNPNVVELTDVGVNGGAVNSTISLRRRPAAFIKSKLARFIESNKANRWKLQRENRQRFIQERGLAENNIELGKWIDRVCAFLFPFSFSWFLFGMFVQLP